MSGPWRSIRKHLNFFRIHLMFFTFTPLICSGIFYASNGRYHITYIDALFNCISAMTVCGLATVNLSSLTRWQQVILFVQMCLGSPVLISWIVVFLRRRHFAKKLDFIIGTAALGKNAAGDLGDSQKRSVSWSSRIAMFLWPGGVSLSSKSGLAVDTKEKGGSMQNPRSYMIKRMDEAPRRINPSGFAVPMNQVSTSRHGGQNTIHTGYSSFAISSDGDLLHPKPIRRGANPSNQRTRRLSDPGLSSRPDLLVSSPLKKYGTIGYPPPSTGSTKIFPLSQTVEFAPSVTRRRGRLGRTVSIVEELRPVELVGSSDRRSTHSRGPSLSHQASIVTHATGYTSRTRRTSRGSKHRGLGGFPMPHILFSRFLTRYFPKLMRGLTRTVTIPVITPLTPQREDTPAGTKSVPYISFDAIVGRNSSFHLLTRTQVEELGGVEYRALNALLWIVAAYHIGTQLVAFTVIAPYMSSARWSEIFTSPPQLRPFSAAWFSLFQCVSAYTNTGMSLADQSMVPFRTAYPMLFLLVFLILAGNTAFPVFLRLTIWILSKSVPNQSRAYETLHFLLDHPRRCFIYLFPSHQTWFLLTVVFSLTVIDWLFFLVLDIGNPTVEVIPLATRFAVGLLQATAVRSAGFVAVSLASIAAGVKVLFVIMMYISVYPIALSVRSSNVYEEQSLGIFQNDEEDEDDFEATGPRMTIWSRYLAMHARKQLAFDMWWIGGALFLLCIIERHNLDDPTSDSWFNIFSMVFELVSAYGTVGLSLGVPYDGYSFAGALRPLSKLILCFVMLRGRHRGLPVAIDRAVMLPFEFQQSPEEDDPILGSQDRGSGTTQARHTTSQREAHPGEDSG